MVRKKVWVLYQFHARIMGRLLMMMMTIFASDKMRLSFCSEVWKCTALLQQIDSSPLVSKASFPPHPWVLHHNTQDGECKAHGITLRPVGCHWTSSKAIELGSFSVCQWWVLLNWQIFICLMKIAIWGIPHSIFLDPFVCRRNAERRI